jgi:DNA-binding CsgD family transcriptional regulator
VKEAMREEDVWDPGAQEADPRATYELARASRDHGDRLLAQGLDTIDALVPISLGLAFKVDRHGLMNGVMVGVGGGGDPADAGRLVERLRRLEPIDPFSPRRAEASGASLLSAADMGGKDRIASSLYGRHLRRHGYGAPLALYLRTEGRRVTAGLMLFRTARGAAYDTPTVRLLAQLRPVLEHALRFTTRRRPTRTPADHARGANLTPREADVARLVGQGATNAAIAHALGMSEATVKTHLTRVYTKLRIRSRTQLAVLLGRCG